MKGEREGGEGEDLLRPGQGVTEGETRVSVTGTLCGPVLV